MIRGKVLITQRLRRLAAAHPRRVPLLRRGTAAARRAAVREAPRRRTSSRSEVDVHDAGRALAAEEAVPVPRPHPARPRADAPLQPRLPVLPQLGRRHGADRHRHVVRGGGARRRHRVPVDRLGHHDRVPGRRAHRQLGRAAARRRVRDAEERRGREGPLVRAGHEPVADGRRAARRSSSTTRSRSARASTGRPTSTTRSASSRAATATSCSSSG